MSKENYAHGQYEVGDKIKAFDFQPIEGRKDRYVIGEIIGCDYYHQRNVLKYKVEVEKDTMADENPNGKRDIVFVPLGISIGEFDERVQLVDEKKETLEQFSHVEITERVPDLINGGTNLPGKYPVEDINWKTGELIYWVDAETGGKEISRRLAVDPFDPNLGGLPVVFYSSAELTSFESAAYEIAHSASKQEYSLWNIREMVAQDLEVSFGEAKRLLDNLEEKGYISRIPAEKVNKDYLLRFPLEG